MCWRFRAPAKSTSRGVRAARPRSAEAATISTGLFVHPVLAVDTDSNVIFGLADVRLWQRHRTAAKEASRTTDEKIRRWLAGAEAAASLRAARSTAVTVVADREGDLYPAFARRPGAVELWSAQRPSAGSPSPLSVRTCRWSSRRRSLHSRSARRPRTSRAARRNRPALPPGRFEPASNSADRDLRQPSRSTPWMPRDRGTGSGSRRSIARLLAVLLSIVATANQAIADYRRRWHIEQLFQTLKSQGLDLEDSRIKTPHVSTRSPSSPCAPPLCACGWSMRAAAPISGRPWLARD